MDRYEVICSLAVIYLLWAFPIDMVTIPLVRALYSETASNGVTQDVKIWDSKLLQRIKKNPNAYVDP